MNSKDKLAIELKSFEFTYPRCTKPAVGPLNLTLNKGDFAILVGDTGIGKSTLLKALLPDSPIAGKRCGSAIINSQTLGYVSQSPENQLVCESVWHEIAFALENHGTPRSLMRRRVAEVSHFFGIEPWFHKNVNDLSGGQMQLVNLARTLATGPEILLLDEPSAELDPVAEKKFLHEIFRINRELGITILLVTHTPEVVADYATRAIEMNKSFEGVTKTSEVPLSTFAHSGAINAPSRKLSTQTSSCIKVDDVHFRYSKEEQFVMHGCDLDVKVGEIRAIVGGNGCGKSTLLKLIAGIIRPERGRIQNALQTMQAYLPQHPAALFICDTVVEELCEWQNNCSYSHDDVQAMEEKVALSQCEDLHPYDLSGGQQQMLGLAKLLLTKPKLLLLDEPTKGLDPKTKITVANLILDYAKNGGTVLMSTHDLAFARCVADTTTMVFDGQATCTENSDEFFSNNLFFRPNTSTFTDLFQQQLNKQ
ncbi:ABC transporter ATP-binding protein [Phoenicibacter congonensis]|uniref:ABC transporter ATP-binding protein n=1 Tax=Phoenicibacter congonensis TaxID=1944646 RepID=UPI0009A580A1|nr:ATP-binding cassette domain-containing protein [Phoenicibacter congonensis]